LKYFSADALGFSADGKAFAVFFNLYLLERFEVLLDVRPLKSVLIIGQALIEFFSKDQGKKAAKHMACNIRIILMVNGSGLQKRFDIPEHALDSPQLLVLESNLIGRQISVCLDQWHQGGNIRGVAWPHLATDRPAIIIKYGTNDRLVQIWSVVFAKAPAAKITPTLTFEVNRGRIKKD
jgi:hypothetical protein